MKKQVYIEMKNILIKLKKVMTSTVEMYGVLEDDYTNSNNEELKDILGKFKL